MCITPDLKSSRLLIFGFDVNKPLSFDENKMNKRRCGLNLKLTDIGFDFYQGLSTVINIVI